MSVPEASKPARPPEQAFCSRLSAERGLPPVGTAGCYDAVLAFELAAPWTPKLRGSTASDERLDDAIKVVGKKSKKTRLLAIEPSDELRRARGGSHVRVLHFFRQGTAFSAYARREYDVPRAALATVLEGLAGASEEDASRYEVPAAAGRDVLVCTHGARDACCGKFGYGFYVEMRDAAARRSDAVRVWRTSHLGGHRFAPTLLDLPSGRMFGRLAASDARVILEGGDGLLARLAAIYRGRCALPEPAQIVERELWLQVGETFERQAIEASATEDADGWNVRVSCGSASLDARVARVDAGAVVTPASCGRDPEPEAPWRIVA